MAHAARSFRSLLFVTSLLGLVSACGGGGGGDDSSAPATYTISTSAGANGSISPGSATVSSGSTRTFTITANAGYAIDSVTGCGGALAGNAYTTGPVTGSCTVTANFALLNYMVSTSAGANGSISPTSATVDHGSTTDFTITPDSGFVIDAVTGCDGTLAGDTYTTGVITAACTVTASFGFDSPPVAAAAASFAIDAVKIFRITWSDVSDATHYRLLENPDGSSGFTQVGADIPPGTEIIDHVVPLYGRFNASYILQSCNSAGCTDAVAVGPSDTLASAIGFFKASNTDEDDRFGWAMSLSADGKTLVIGAWGEASGTTGINGDQADNSATQAGAAYVFVRDDFGDWSQQAYLKASNTDFADKFGYSVSLSADGNSLAVGSQFEASNSTGVAGDESNNFADNAGAVYVFSRTGQDWAQTAYLKASNTGRDDWFGSQVAMSGDGATLAVSAEREQGGANGIDGDQTDNSVDYAGAVYVFTLNAGTWSQQAYVKPSSIDMWDTFGSSLAISHDGNTLVAASIEASGSTGIGGDDTDNSADGSGAAYVFSRSADVWSQEAFIKSSNSESPDLFAASLDLSGDGNTLVVGAWGEDSAATGVNGDESDNSLQDAGAAYVFRRTAGSWSQQAYLKASNTGATDLFGAAVTVSDDGDVVAVSATEEDSNSIGINGVQSDPSNLNLGAVYVFRFDAGTWAETAFVKPSSLGQNDSFGHRLSLSGDGGTLAVGAYTENSAATGIGGNQSDNTAPDSGAVFVF